MAARDLCALADVKRYLPGYQADTATDAALTALITSISTDTYRGTAREFTPRATQPTARLFELDWWSVENRELPIGDLANATGLTVELLLEDGTLDQTLAAGGYITLPRAQDLDAWEPITDLKFPRLVQSPAEPARLAYRKQVRVTGNFGFPQIPPDIVENVAKLVVVRYVTDVASDGTEITDDMANINLGGIFKSATETIDSFRVPTIG